MVPATGGDLRARFSSLSVAFRAGAASCTLGGISPGTSTGAPFTAAVYALDERAANGYSFPQMANSDDVKQPAEEAEGDKEDSGVRGRLEQLLPDIVKRTFYAGLGAVFTTEEGIRKIASDFH